MLAKARGTGNNPQILVCIYQPHSKIWLLHKLCRNSNWAYPLILLDTGWLCLFLHMYCGPVESTCALVYIGQCIRQQCDANAWLHVHMYSIIYVSRQGILIDYLQWVIVTLRCSSHVQLVYTSPFYTTVGIKYIMYLLLLKFQRQIQGIFLCFSKMTVKVLGCMHRCGLTL